jgi:hypothetical protein
MLMWSLTNLDFLIYDFSLIYYDFFKDLATTNRKENSKLSYQKFYTKAYHIIYSQKYYFFMIILWFTMIF